MSGRAEAAPGPGQGGKWLSMSRNKPTNEVVFLFCPKHCARGGGQIYYTVFKMD